MKIYELGQNFNYGFAWYRNGQPNSGQTLSYVVVDENNNTLSSGSMSEQGTTAFYSFPFTNGFSVATNITVRIFRQNGRLLNSENIAILPLASIFGGNGEVLEAIEEADRFQDGLVV